MPNTSWNSNSAVARLAASNPAPKITPPASTTARVPQRSDSQPHTNAATPSDKKLIADATDTPAVDQPISAPIGCRNTPSDIIEPMPRHVTTMPTATITQP